MAEIKGQEKDVFAQLLMMGQDLKYDIYGMPKRSDCVIKPEKPTKSKVQNNQ